MNYSFQGEAVSGLFIQSHPSAGLPTDGSGVLKFAAILSFGHHQHRLHSVTEQVLLPDGSIVVTDFLTLDLRKLDTILR